jgi:phosphoglycerate kinase
MGLDAGPKSRDQFNDVLLNSRTILWNGPIGVFEMSNFAAGTVALETVLPKLQNWELSL